MKNMIRFQAIRPFVIFFLALMFGGGVTSGFSQAEASSTPRVDLRPAKLSYFKTPGSSYAGCVSSYAATYESTYSSRLSQAGLQSLLRINSSFRRDPLNPDVRIKVMAKGGMSQGGSPQAYTPDGSSRTYYYYNLYYSAQVSYRIEHCSGSYIDAGAFQHASIRSETFPTKIETYTDPRQLEAAWNKNKRSVERNLESKLVDTYITRVGNQFNSLLSFQSYRITPYIAVPNTYRSKKDKRTYSYAEFDSAARQVIEGCARLSVQDTLKGYPMIRAAIDTWEKALEKAEGGDTDRLPARYRMWTLSNLMVGYSVMRYSDEKIRSVQEQIKTRFIKDRNKIPFYKLAVLKVKLYKTQYRKDKCGRTDLPICEKVQSPEITENTPSGNIPNRSVDIDINFEGGTLKQNRYVVEADSVFIKVGITTKALRPKVTLYVNDKVLPYTYTPDGANFQYEASTFLPKRVNLVKVIVQSARGRILARKVDTVERLPFLIHKQDYALLVATWQYKHTCTQGDCPNQLHKLVNPPREILALKKVLEESYGFEVSTLENPQSQKDLSEAIDAILTKANLSPGSQVLIYLTGHGLIDKTVGYYALSQTNPNDLEGSASAYPIMKTRIASHPLNKVLVMIDACHSGAFLEARRGETPKPEGGFNDIITRYIEQKKKGKGVHGFEIESSLSNRTHYALTACAFDETTFESHTGFSLSPFASAFQAILETGVAQEASIDLVTLRDLIRVVSPAGVTPQSGIFQGTDESFYFEYRPDFNPDELLDK